MSDIVGTIYAAAGSLGVATVTAGSQWGSTVGLYVGTNGRGTLTSAAGA